jgi:predicted peptidase
LFVLRKFSSVISLICIVFFGMTSVTDASVVGYRMTTDILESGQRLIFFSVEYDKEISESSLSKDTFDISIVSPDNTLHRVPISAVYTSNAGSDPLGNAPEPSNGKYLIAKVDIGGSPFLFSQTYFYPGSTMQWKDYKVAQALNFLYADGTEQPLSPAEIRRLGRRDLQVERFGPERVYSNTAIADPVTSGDLYYYLFEPQKEQGRKYPLVLSLHGGGERRNYPGAQMFANTAATIWTTPEMQAAHPSYVLAPQVWPANYKFLPEGSPRSLDGWMTESIQKQTIALIDKLIAEESVDQTRIYVHGMSMGGAGTLSFINRYPQYFAAAMPICGATVNYVETENIKDYKGQDKTIHTVKGMETALKPAVDAGVAIRMYHAEDDETVNINNSRNAWQALKNLGIEQGDKYNYFEYPANYAGIFPPESRHQSWEAVYLQEDALNWFWNYHK